VINLNISNSISQCAVPVFDGLLPEPHNRVIVQLLFVTAHWHGLAKFRMHTDATLEVMDAVTSDLGKKLRAFQQKTCTAFETKELPREANARIRKQMQRVQVNSVHSKSGTLSSGELSYCQDAFVGVLSILGSGLPQSEDQAISSNSKSRGATRHLKMLNLNTYKFHALGDYTSTIRRYGTTDSYSTEAVRPL
jgi:hypothetical protein